MRVPDRMVATRLGPLHHRHPLIVVAEEGEVQVRTAAVRLGADGQLAQQPTHSLRVPAVLGVHNSVFESAGHIKQFSPPPTPPTKQTKRNTIVYGGQEIRPQDIRLKK